ncbi:MAG TPA: chemotaxis protein CheW [Firmicutes bacterium]|nr:chemotaxis protein CheW [Bacillota bacterium]
MGYRGCYELAVANLAEETQLVTFKLGNEEYGVDIMQVQEIIRLTNIVKVPNAPHFVEGVIDLRSRVIPIIDLRKRFGIPECGKTGSSRIVVVNMNDTTVGLIVDSVSEVIRIPVKALEPLPEIATSVDSRFLRGIARVEDRLIILIDLACVLSRDESSALEMLESSTHKGEG